MATMEQIWSMTGDDDLIASFHKSYCPFKENIILPVKFTYDGVHIKVVTRCCGGFIRVTGKDAVPKAIESKNNTRSLFKRDELHYINFVKSELKMPDTYKSEFDKDIAYHNLFAEIIHRADVRKYNEDVLWKD